MFNTQMSGKHFNLPLRSVAWLKSFPIHGIYGIRWYSSRFTDTRQIRTLDYYGQFAGERKSTIVSLN